MSRSEWADFHLTRSLVHRVLESNLNRVWACEMGLRTAADRYEAARDAYADTLILSIRGA